MIESLFLGALLSGSVALLGYQRRSLSKSGVIGAILTGTLSVVAGWRWAVIVIAFFISSSALSKIGEHQKAAARAQFSKGEQRDFWQVMANGGAGIVIALVYLLQPQPELWIAYLATYATVTADTWATEIGTLSRRTPRLITSFRPVESGTSGGITPLGILTSSAGAGFIALAGGLFSLKIGSIIVILLAGLAGSLFDSLLGATVQALFWCEDGGKLTEKSICPDGRPAELRQGYAFINNDVVNFCAAVFGAIGGGLAAVFLVV